MTNPTHEIVRPKPLDLLILLTLGVIWGTAYAAIKIAVEEISPITLVALRCLIGFLAVWIFLMLASSKAQPINWKTLPYARLIIIAIMGTVLPFFLINWAEQHVESVVAGLMNTTGPLMVLIAGHFIAKTELITKTRMLGVLIGMFGVGLLMYEGFALLGRDSLLAQTALLLAFAGYAISNLMVRGQTALNPPQLTCFTLGIAALISMPIALLFAPFDITTWSKQAWVALLWLSVMSTAFAFSLRYLLVMRAGAGFTSNVGFLIPIVAMIIGFFIGEQISALKLAALATVLLSLYVATKAGTKLKKRQ